MNQHSDENRHLHRLPATTSAGCPDSQALMQERFPKSDKTRKIVANVTGKTNGISDFVIFFTKSVVSKAATAIRDGDTDQRSLLVVPSCQDRCRLTTAKTTHRNRLSATFCVSEIIRLTSPIACNNSTLGCGRIDNNALTLTAMPTSDHLVGNPRERSSICRPTAPPGCLVARPPNLLPTYGPFF